MLIRLNHNQMFRYHYLILFWLLFSFTSHGQTLEEYFEELPRQFSPGGNGVNDTWGKYINDVEKVNFKIYSRWGTLIFEGDNNTTWNGYTLSGDLCPQGVYIYIFNIVKNGETKIFKGAVEIIK